MAEFKKIQEFVAKNLLKPSDCLYHTNRSAKNAKKEMTGKIRVLATKDGIAHTEYICPECKHYDYIEIEWKRPFSVRCSKCNFKISVPKMKDEAKREAKQDVK